MSSLGVPVANDSCDQSRPCRNMLRHGRVLARGACSVAGFNDSLRTGNGFPKNLMYSISLSVQTERIALSKALNARVRFVGHHVLSTLYLLAQGILLRISRPYGPGQLLKLGLSSRQALRRIQRTGSPSQSTLSLRRCPPSLLCTLSAPHGSSAR